MLITEVKEGESIDRALKRFKRKYRNVKLLREIRDRQQFTKKSVKKRQIKKKAQYRELYLRANEEY